MTSHITANRAESRARRAPAKITGLLTTVALFIGVAKMAWGNSR